ncbi:hypothetical protein [Sporolactobacillus vineae]|uniref:hypothetical protein n=1 Tax=Sporolactobacillus vineae TaxID=444463 RepID=UPI00028843DA|nr:hypothetical protein [Sporolactobacillus vineae]
MNDISVNQAIQLIDQGRELDFTYQGETYSITHLGNAKEITHHGLWMDYQSGEALFTQHRIQGKRLADIWKNAEVDIIF